MFHAHVFLVFHVPCMEAAPETTIKAAFDEEALLKRGLLQIEVSFN